MDKAILPLLQSQLLSMELGKDHYHNKDLKLPLELLLLPLDNIQASQQLQFAHYSLQVVHLDYKIFNLIKTTTQATKLHKLIMEPLLTILMTK